jgi:hypothetical protein
MLCQAIEKKKKLEKRLKKKECVHKEKSNPKALPVCFKEAVLQELQVNSFL